MNDSGQTVCIATWNLERPSLNGWAKNQGRLNKICQISADLWVLTETSSAISPRGDYTAVESYPLPGYHRTGENLSTIWSRWNVYRRIPTFDPAFTVCAEIESPFGAVIVYGTVIPYANDKGLSGTAKRWEEHRRSIRQHCEDWSRIKQRIPITCSVSREISIKVEMVQVGMKMQSLLIC